jgi:hypothetical protein
MKSYLILLGLLIVTAVTLAIAITRPLPQDATGGPHPSHAEMKQGGTPERHQGKLLLGWIYGAAQIGLFMVAIGISIPQGRPGRGWLAAGTLIYFAVFSAMMLAYAQDHEGVPFILGFPLPTAVLVFGMWPASALFSVLYATHFRAWIYSEADAKRFAEIKAQYPGGDTHGY